MVARTYEVVLSGITTMYFCHANIKFKSFLIKQLDYELEISIA